MKRRIQKVNISNFRNNNCPHFFFIYSWNWIINIHDDEFQSLCTMLKQKKKFFSQQIYIHVHMDTCLSVSQSVCIKQNIMYTVKFRSTPFCNKSIITSCHHRNCDDRWLLMKMNLVKFPSSAIRIHAAHTHTHTYMPSICLSILMGKFVYKYTHSLTHSNEHKHTLTLAALFEKISNFTSYHMCDTNNLLKWYASRIQVHVIFLFCSFNSFHMLSFYSIYIYEYVNDT